MTNKSIESVNEYLDLIIDINKNQNVIAKNERERYINLSAVNDNNLGEMRLYFQKVANIKGINKYSIPDNKDIAHDKYKLYYRGHSKTSYRLIPSTFRGDDWSKEDWYYHEIMVRCPEHFQYESHLDKLVTMQHYECPTRLLDVTSNPLVALFFACKSFGCKKCNHDELGEVIIFPVKESEILYSDSDRALMLSCLARFSAEEKEELHKLAHDRLFDDSFTQKQGGSSYRDIVVERFFHEITTELPSFKRTIKPIDILMPIFIQPNKTNGRILKQDGAFIINGLSSDSVAAENKLNALEHTRIRVENKEAILKELSTIGINEATLFPEVDKVAHFLKES